MKVPDIPIGQQGNFDGTDYICIAYVRRGTDFDGDRYSWEEYLLWSQPIGFRWLVKDPEQGWLWVMPTNPADIDITQSPSSVAWGGRTFKYRNSSSAEVEYVLGEVYWKCSIGETTEVTDFIDGREVLSREEGTGEVRWSYSAPTPWATIAAAFNLPVDGPGSKFGAAGAGMAGAAGSGSGCTTSGVVWGIIILVVLVFCALGACGSCADDSGYSGGSSSGYRGGGVYYGGK